MGMLNEAVVIFYGLCLLVIFAYTIIQTILAINYLRDRKNNAVMSENGLELEDFPIVTVQLPVYNERYVVERLIQAITAFEWPKEKLEIQVLDDSDDETVEIIAREVKIWAQHLIPHRACQTISPRRNYILT